LANEGALCELAKISANSNIKRYAKLAKSHIVPQTTDIYGNVTQVQNFDFGNLSTPIRTYNYTYLNSGSYPSLCIYNRLAHATVTDGTNTTTLATNYYDTLAPSPCFNGGSVGSVSGLREWTPPTPPAF
jgi:S-adenosylmethionine hydrolase